MKPIAQFDSHDLANTFAANTGEPLDRWVSVLEQGRSLYGRARLSSDDLEILGQHCPSSSNWLPVLELLARRPIRHPQDPGPFEGIKTLAAESAFTLDAWIESLYQFQHYLAGQGRQSDLDAMLGYLSCVSESAMSQTTRPTLVNHLKDSLDAFGYEG